MKVSVVIPAYNEEAYLQRLLDALQKQTVQPDEIIVVDNNSTDRTVEIAKKYPVRIVREKKQAIVYARNAGFNEAKYDLIVRFDADSVPPPTYIEIVKKIFQTEPIVALSTKIKYDVPYFSVLDFVIDLVYNSTARVGGLSETLYGPNMAILRSAWEKIKNAECVNSSKFNEDVDIALHLSHVGTIKKYSELTVLTSARRMKHRPKSFFWEYSNMMMRTLSYHKKYFSKEANNVSLQ